MDVIQLEGMEFFAYHGCTIEEQQAGGKFLVDLTIETELQTAGFTDIIEDTIDYQKLYEIINAQMQKPSHLLEHVATRIIEAIYKNYPSIKRTYIKVSKLNPPVGGKVEKASVSLMR